MATYEEVSAVYIGAIREVAETLGGEQWDEVGLLAVWEAARVDILARLDEAEEKLTYLAAGCTGLTREELIARITAVGPARYRAGVYWQARDSRKHAEGFRDAIAFIKQHPGSRCGEAIDAAQAEAVRLIAASPLEVKS